MKRKTLIIAAAAVAAFSVLSQTASAQSKPATPPVETPQRKARLEDQYKLLLDRSIFSKERTRPGAKGPSTKPSTPKREAQDVTVFTGVMVQDGEFVAFFENRQSGDGIAVHEGESLAGGKVSEISLDWLKYVTATGTAREIRIGQNLTGEAPPADLVPTSEASSGGPSSSAESPNDSVAEKMRKRRMRELGQ